MLKIMFNLLFVNFCYVHISFLIAFSFSVLLCHPTLFAAPNEEEAAVSDANGQSPIERDERIREGVILLRGIGVDPDPQRGFRLLQDAASDGSAEAMHRLGLESLDPLSPFYNLEEGVRFIRQAAESGYGVAMGAMASIYHTGMGVLADPEQSEMWEERTLRSGDAEAIIRTARWRIAGGGALPLDPDEGLFRLRKLAQMGITRAKSFLGGYLLNREEDPAQVAEGLRWTREAANEGDPKAQTELGVRYHYGFGLPRDLEKAMSWYISACDQEDAMAMWLRGQLYRTSVWPGGPDDSASFEWTLKAAQQGLDLAQQDIAIHYYLGVGVEIDPKRARYWVKRAENSYRKEFLYELGRNLWDGHWLFQDADWGQRLVTRVAELGYAPAQLELSRRFAVGHGIERNPDRAQYWANQVGEPSFYEEAWKMAQILLETGGGDDSLLAKGREYLRQAARGGSPEAQYRLGKALLAGDAGFERDREEGTYWLRRAAEQGHNPDNIPLDGDADEHQEEIIHPSP